MWPERTARFVPPDRLIFKSTDGSLSWAGASMVGVGVFLLVASVCEIVAAVCWARRSDRYRAIQVVLGAWGAAGLIVGAAFVAWPYLASPGALY